MGYVHDTHMSQFIPPAVIAKTAGTWTPSVASNVAKEARTAGDAAFTLIIPIPIPSNASALKGAKLKSIDVWYKIATGAADDFATVTLNQVALPGDADAPAGEEVTVTLDAAHDSAAERKAVADHKMTVTLSTPVWLNDDDAYFLSLVVDAAANTAFTLYGARANYELRV
ncbi:MAG: hypothetical protein IT308_09420 [Anaerolineaceae bacterium]|nr:hypothetical protein [Anaerolineaceae bacterium]